MEEKKEGGRTSREAERIEKGKMLNKTDEELFLFFYLSRLHVLDFEDGVLYDLHFFGFKVFFFFF